MGHPGTSPANETRPRASLAWRRELRRSMGAGASRQPPPTKLRKLTWKPGTRSSPIGICVLSWTRRAGLSSESSAGRAAGWPAARRPVRRACCRPQVGRLAVGRLAVVAAHPRCRRRPSRRRVVAARRPQASTSPRPLSPSRRGAQGPEDRAVRPAAASVAHPPAGPTSRVPRGATPQPATPAHLQPAPAYSVSYSLACANLRATLGDVTATCCVTFALA